MKSTLRIFKPYIPYMLLIVILLFGQGLCELALPTFMADIVDNGIAKKAQSYIYRTGGIMVLLALGSMVCAVVASLISSRIAAAATRDLRGRLFRCVMNFSTGEFDRFSTASLITRSTNDVQNIQQTSIMLLRMAVFPPVMGIGALIMALETAPGLAWTIALALLVILSVMAVVFILVMPKFSIIQRLLDKINLITSERLSGLLIVRAFNSEDTEENRLDEVNSELTKLNILVNRAMSLLFPTLTLVMNGVSLLIVWVGAGMAEAGTLQIGSILAFIQYATHIIISFLFITMMFIMLPRAAVSAKRAGAVLDAVPEIQDPKNPADPPKDGCVRFHDVNFSYPNSEENAVSNISFTAEAGKTTAIIGGTGSGKSSLINLIPRFYDVSSGSVTIGGTDVRDLTQSDLHNMIGIVPQKSVLFSGTIEENLRFGKRDATQEEIDAVCRIAQADEFISSMPKGLKSEISQGGTSVSGGQKQRLAIARALLKEAKIYIFDDSFSALDFATDARLRAALKEKSEDKVFIIVAQRISTIADADQILVLDEGKLVGKGSHKELLDTCDVYREIAFSQLSEEELRREGIEA